MSTVCAKCEKIGPPPARMTGRSQGLVVAWLTFGSLSVAMSKSPLVANCRSALMAR